jgi:hypothetical protein
MNPGRNPGVDTLITDRAYRLVRELSFQDMIPFVLAQMKGKGMMSVIYLVVNLVIFGLIAMIIAVGLFKGTITWRVIIGQSLAGIVSGSLLVIPVHELLHGLAYRILGAKRIRFGVDLKQLIFFVTADRYPVSGNQLYFLALVPFAVINIATIVLVLVVIPEFILVAGLFLLSHNIMCIGDFAIANYVYRSGGRLYSSDEPDKKKSYFYEKVNQEGSPKSGKIPS